MKIRTLAVLFHQGLHFPQDQQPTGSDLGALSTTLVINCRHVGLHKARFVKKSTHCLKYQFLSETKNSFVDLSERYPSPARRPERDQERPEGSPGEASPRGDSPRGPEGRRGSPGDHDDGKSGSDSGSDSDESSDDDGDGAMGRRMKSSIAHVRVSAIKG